MGQTASLTEAPSASSNPSTLLRVLAAASFCHFLNDMLQALLPSIYPVLKTSFHLNFTQIGYLTLTYQITASLLQPFIGHLTDRTPRTYALPVGMGITLIGLIVLAFAPSFLWLIIAASIIGVGSAIFHPESSRIARMASGGRHGFAQSFFQVGGNTGSAVGPLVAAFVILPRGQSGIGLFAIPAVAGIVVLLWISRWYKAQRTVIAKLPTTEAAPHRHLSRGKIIGAISILCALTFSKYFYLVSLTSYYTFYLISRFQVSVRTS